MEQALPKLLGGLVPVSIAIIVYLMAYLSQRRTYQIFWLIALGCYWLRHFVALFIKGHFDGQDNVAWLYGVLVMIAAYFLFLGTRRLLGKKTAYWPIAAILIGSLITKIFLNLELNASIMALPVSLGVASCYLFAGIDVLRSAFFRQWHGNLLFFSLIFMTILQGLFTPIALSFTTTHQLHFLLSGLTESILITSLVIVYFRSKEKELDQARQSAEMATRARDRFLANMSHELRTPLHGILGMLDLVEREQSQRTRAGYLHMARQAADAMQERIKDILDLSSLQSGRPRLKEETFSLRELMDSVVAAIAAQAHAKRLDLAGYVDNGVPELVIGDAERLRQVLLNLGANAVKFTPEGFVVIRAESAGLETGSAKVLFSSQDSGIGMSPDEARKIFEPFHRVDDELAAKQEGSGLGLAISSQLVSAMGGEIQVHSRPGRGSTFSFSLDFLLAEPNPEPVAAGLAEPSAAALTVTRRPATASALIQMLAVHGISCKEVDPDSLKTGIVEAGLWFVDRDLPASELAAIDNRAALQKPPAQVVSMRELGVGAAVSSASPGDENTLPLPLSSHAIQSMLSRLGCLETPPPARDHDAPSPPLYKKNGFRPNILVAEDNAISQTIMKTMLNQRGMDVELVGDGQLALECAQARPYDLILLDMRMPGRDGLDVARAIRGDENCPNNDTPISAVTAQAYDSDRRAARDAGMNHFLTKPMKENDLDRLLGELFQAEPQWGGLQSTEPVENWQEQAEKMFRASRDEELAEMEGLLAKGELAQLARAAHRFKSGLVLFGGQTSMESLAALQASAEAGSVRQSAYHLNLLKTSLAGNNKTGA